MKLRASVPDSVIGVPEPLCLLTVHAHPDDESSKGAGTVAMYHAEGIHTVLVCCTGGEEGEILNPALDTPEVHGYDPDTGYRVYTAKAIESRLSAVAVDPQAGG